MRMGALVLLAPFLSSSSLLRLGAPEDAEVGVSPPPGPLPVLMAPSLMRLGALEETGGPPPPGPDLVLPLDKAGGS